MSRAKRSTIILAVTALVVVGGAGGWLIYQSVNEANPASGTARQEPTFRSSDGTTRIRVPPDAMSPNTTVTFTPIADQTPGLNATLRGARAAGTPVDIHVTTGSLEPNRSTVTLTYDPAFIPVGLTAKQVGLAVFDPNLDSWIPLLDAKADPTTHTVSAIAPHFSWFSTIVLDPAKAVVNIAGKAIHTVIDAGTTIARWTGDLLKELTHALVNDLLGIAPDLACEPASPDVTVSTASTLDRLSGCAQSGPDQDTTIRLRNGYAFPMRLDKLPSGMSLRRTDIWNDGEDVVNLVRNAFWSTQGRMVLSGASVGTVTAAPDFRDSATLTMDLDSDAVAFDMALAFLMVIAPEQTAVKPAVKAAAESALKGTVTKGEPMNPSAWVREAFGALDCIIKEAHTEAPADVYSSKGIRAAADVVYQCLSDVLKQLNLKGALVDLLGVVKVLPETVETVLYGLGGAMAEQLGELTQHKPTATVERHDNTIRFDGIGAMTLSMTAADLHARGYIDEGNTYESTDPTCVSYRKDGQPLAFSVEPATGRVLAIRNESGNERLSTKIGGLHIGATLAQLRTAYTGYTIHEYLDLDFGQGSNGVIVDGPGGSIAFSLADGSPADYDTGQATITFLNGVGLPGHAPTNMELGC
jgi:hypothetical protein